MKKTKLSSIYVSLFLFFVSCTNKSSENEFLMGFNFGEPEIIWKQKIDSLLNANILSEPYVKTKPNSYRYFINEIPVEVEINDIYESGNLRCITYNLGGDTIYYQEINGNNQDNIKTFTTPGRVSYKSQKAPYRKRAMGERSYHEGIAILNCLKNSFGQPDSINTFYPVKNFILSNGDTTKFKLFDNDYKAVDSILYNPEPNIYALWKKETYTIELVLSSLFSLRDDWENDKYIKPYNSTISDDSRISFKINSYEQKISEIKDNIKQSYSIEDLVEFYMGDPEWNIETQYSQYVYELQCELLSIHRSLTEEDRDIIEVKFDIVVLNSFDDELCRIENLIYEPSNGLENGTSLMRIGKVFGIKYALNIYGEAYEKARKYAKNHNVYSIAYIKAIVFDDRTVKKN